jgi:hypothetical protein
VAQKKRKPKETEENRGSKKEKTEENRRKPWLKKEKTEENRRKPWQLLRPRIARISLISHPKDNS